MVESFEIKKGTQGLLVTEEPGVNVSTKKWTTRKNLEYKRENVLVDPNIFKNFNSIYPAKSLAAKLAKDGYYIFGNSKTSNSKYSLAIKAHDIHIS